jgi:hypothetical protein
VRRHLPIAIVVGLAAIAGSAEMQAQDRGTAAGAAPRASMPVDLTGYWVAFVTEDWRYRMVTPPRGDYDGVPITAEARKIADGWDPAADEAAGNQCRSYGAAAIMRVPGRLHVTWEDDKTLRIDTDAGMQRRLFHFDSPPAAPAARSWQGFSSAQWERPARGRGPGPENATIGGSMKVVTKAMRTGYLRRNGVPYSENAELTEYFELSPFPGGGRLLLVTAVVEDPQYLRQPFIVSSQFKKEADGSKWDPTPCSARW